MKYKSKYIFLKEQYDGIPKILGSDRTKLRNCEPIGHYDDYHAKVDITINNETIKGYIKPEPNRSNIAFSICAYIAIMIIFLKNA